MAAKQRKSNPAAGRKRKVSKRNPVARAAILGKGGAHGKSRKAERQSDKRKLKEELDSD